MRYIHAILLGVLAICISGLWGCGQQKTGAVAAKIQELENRYAKLEEDFCTLQRLSAETRRQLGVVETARSALEAEKAELAKTVETAIGERDSLRKMMSQRTAERDAARVNLAEFNKDLQALASRVQAAMGETPPGPAIIPTSRRSE